MNWLVLLRAVFSLADKLLVYVRERELVTAGEAKEAAKNLEATLNAVRKASVARSNAVDLFDRNGGVLDNGDKHLRD